MMRQMHTYGIYIYHAHSTTTTQKGHVGGGTLLVLMYFSCPCPASQLDSFRHSQELKDVKKEMD